eukprot:TRINITY_DN2001_c0_g4_i1.p1 TRINITY_DN2001_c0_g4~~TRINITY_DN2001_c0_g4_i1.p1  ORF type:complete len:127 (-),score=29.67 TRINITY_DN2001_c0_g4_i1:135-515(-)
MLGLLRSAVAAGRATAARRPNQVVQQAKNTAIIPFVPVDWVFRFCRYGWVRDRVRFLYWFNVMAFGIGFFYMTLYAHTPYACSNYDHFYESPLYKYVRGNLEKTGQLEENLRVKYTSFYPPEADDE